VNDLKYNMEPGKSSEPPASQREYNKAGGPLGGRNTLRGEVRVVGHEHVEKGGKSNKDGGPVESGAALPFLCEKRMRKLRRASNGLAHKVLINALSYPDLLTGKLERRE